MTDHIVSSSDPTVIAPVRPTTRAAPAHQLPMHTRRYTLALPADKFRLTPKSETWRTLAAEDPKAGAMLVHMAKNCMSTFKAFQQARSMHVPPTAI